MKIVDKLTLKGLQSLEKYNSSLYPINIDINTNKCWNFIHRYDLYKGYVFQVILYNYCRIRANYCQTEERNKKS